MKNTLKDVMQDILNPDEIAEINKEVAEEVKKYRGGKRTGSGRKTIIKGKILQFTKRVTDKEAKFIDYAREHNINFDNLMQG